MPQSNVLLVEDTTIDATLVGRHLQTDGRFAVHHVGTLTDAIAAMQNGIEPDVVILDLNLPDSQGLDTFSSLNARFLDTPVVILSGREDEEIAIRALKNGAQDYVPKACVDGPVLVRSLLYSMERNARLVAERRVHRIEHDLATAHKIQGHLLPTDSPTIRGFDVAASCEPADSCGGDFYDFISLPDGKQDVLIADVSGHGFAPALIMAGTRRILRSSAAAQNDLGEILTIANRAVAEDTLVEQFVTLFYLRLDPENRIVSYTSAGHPAWLLHADGVAEVVPSDSIPLGLLPEQEYRTEGRVCMQPGDVLLMMTDGVWEATNSDHQFFGRQRAFDVIDRYRDRPAAEIARAVVDTVRDFRCLQHFDDDVTLVLIKAEDVQCDGSDASVF